MTSPAPSGSRRAGVGLHRERGCGSRGQRLRRGRWPAGARLRGRRRREQREDRSVDAASARTAGERAANADARARTRRRRRCETGHCGSFSSGSGVHATVRALKSNARSSSCGSRSAAAPTEDLAAQLVGERAAEHRAVFALVEAQQQEAGVARVVLAAVLACSCSEVCPYQKSSRRRRRASRRSSSSASRAAESRRGSR